MFTLMDHVRGIIRSHIKQAIVDYQRNERLQDFIDYVQRKVDFLVSLLTFCLFLLTYHMITHHIISLPLLLLLLSIYI